MWLNSFIVAEWISLEWRGNFAISRTDIGNNPWKSWALMSYMEATLMGITPIRLTPATDKNIINNQHISLMDESQS